MLSTLSIQVATSGKARSVTVGGEEHAVPEVLGPSVRLGYGLARRRPREDQGEPEVRVQLPVRIPVQLGGETVGGDAGGLRSGLVEQKTIEDEPVPSFSEGARCSRTWCDRTFEFEMKYSPAISPCDQVPQS